MTLTLIGCGTLGTALARCWTGPVHGVTATTSRHKALRRAVPGISLSTTIEAPQGAVVICAPSSAQASVLDELGCFPPSAPAVLISSTGVYRREGTITADSATGGSARADRLVGLESRFLAWAPHGSIVRLGGLYQDGRGPGAAFARSGAARLAPPNTPLPLIHYDDAARLVLDTLRHPTPFVLGVVHQPTREAFYRRWAGKTGHETPAFSEPVPAPHQFDASPLQDPQAWG